MNENTEMLSMNGFDLDIELLEQRLEMASAFPHADLWYFGGGGSNCGELAVYDDGSWTCFGLGD